MAVVTPPPPPAWCKPRRPCGRCYRCKQSKADARAEAWLAERHPGEKLPSEENTARFLHSVDLPEEERRDFASGRALASDVRSRMGGLAEILRLQLKALERIDAEHERRRAEIERKVAIIEYVYNGEHKGVVEIAKRFGWKGHSSVVECLRRLEEEAIGALRDQRVIAILCEWCGEPVPYRLGGNPPKYCKPEKGKQPCRQAAYHERRGRELRAAQRVLRSTRRKPRPPRPPS